jgi:hypothetical protein
MRFVEIGTLVFIVPYILAVAMPSWRWLLMCGVLVGGILAFLIWEIATSEDRYGDAGIGFLVVLSLGVPFGAGVLVRAMSLIMAARGWSRRRVFGANVLGFALPVGLLVITSAWFAWEYRPPSEACSRATFAIELAGGRISLPAAPIFSIRLGPLPAGSTYNFAIPIKLRDFCALTDEGRRPIRAAEIGIGFGIGASWTDPEFCSASPAAWETKLCAVSAAARLQRNFESDFPFHVYVISSDEVNADAFANSAMADDPALPPSTSRSGSALVQSESRTPDGSPISFTCREVVGRRHRCDTSYPWRDGMHLVYQFRTDDANLGEKGERVDATLREFLEQFLVNSQNRPQP